MAKWWGTVWRLRRVAVYQAGLLWWHTRWVLAWDSKWLYQNIACIHHLSRILVFLSHAALISHGWQLTHVSWNPGIGRKGGLSPWFSRLLPLSSLPLPWPVPQGKNSFGLISAKILDKHSVCPFQLQPSPKLLPVPKLHPELWLIFFFSYKK